MDKILLVEDDKFLLRAYTEGLKDAGFTVMCATDGKEAMEKIRSEKPDLILLDLIMPGENGLSVLEKIKADPALQDILVIVLTNSARESDIAKTRELGAVDYLIKSEYSMTQVVEKVREYLRQNKSLMK